MRRREFITFLGGAAAAWPLVARAQSSSKPIIGFLGAETPDLWSGRLRAFHRGLDDTGYVEGGNVTVEYRWAKGQNDRLEALVADLASRQVSVLAIPASTRAALVAKTMTSTIPIVFATGADPVREGLVTSLNRPGGNVTGITLLGVEIGPKQLELLREMAPMIATIGLLANPTNPALDEPMTKGVQAAAASLGLEFRVLTASSERDFDMAFATLTKQRGAGLIIAPDIFFGSRLEQLGALSLHHALPAIHQFRAFAAAGGLMSYGTDVADAFRLAGVYTGRLLKGEKPTDLPVQQATKTELVINLNTAKALGLTVPLTLLGRADDVIE